MNIAECVGGQIGLQRAIVDLLDRSDRLVFMRVFRRVLSLDTHTHDDKRYRRQKGMPAQIEHFSSTRHSRLHYCPSRVGRALEKDNCSKVECIASMTAASARWVEKVTSPVRTCYLFH